MKTIKFEALQMDGRVPDNYRYGDFGFVKDVRLGLRELFKMAGQQFDDEYLKQSITNPEYTGEEKILGVTTGFYYPDKDILVVCITYTKTGCPLSNLFIRGHEEGHAVCKLGLRSQLEDLIGEPISERYKRMPVEELPEETFCNEAGLYTLKVRGINPFNPLD